MKLLGLVVSQWTTRGAGVAAALIVSVCLVAAACGGGDSGTTASTPTPAPTIYAGSWTGTLVTMSGDRPDYVTFTVTANDIAAARVNLLFLAQNPSRGGAITGAICDNWMTFSGQAAISGDSFTITVTGTYGTTTLRGQFSSPTSASGTVDGFSPASGCYGFIPEPVGQATWTARKL